MRHARVLVVDDEPMVRETLGQVLSDEGYLVDLAVDGESALERVRAARPDAILLDLMMPGMNGRQFLAALRAEPSYADLPVMIMTAVHGLGVAPAALGASEVVEKPFNIDELLNKVAFAIYRTRAARPATAPVVPPPEPAAPAPPRRDRGVVILVEHERARLQALDRELSARGFTVVSMTRALLQLSRLSRALRPRALLLDARCPGTAEVVSDLADTSGMELLPILVFTREPDAQPEGVLTGATDAALVEFVESQPERKPLR